VVVIGDSRVVTKRYGRGLLEALPSARREIGRWGQVRDVVVRFYLAGP
jgi:ATP-dependent DNA helicase DinG